jgi:hypothetical protein
MTVPSAQRQHGHLPRKTAHHAVGDGALLHPPGAYRLVNELAHCVVLPAPTCAAYELQTTGNRSRSSDAKLERRADGTLTVNK